MAGDVFFAVYMYVLCGGFALALVIMITTSICCGESSAEEQAAAQRRAAQQRADLELRQLVELMRPVVPVAAAPVVAERLGYFPYSAEGRRNASQKLVCAICLEEFQHGEECSEVPVCRHSFHRECITVWMKTKTSCPLCRRRIVAGSECVSAAEDMV